MNPLESPLYDPLTEIEGFTDGAPSYYHPSGRWTHMVDKPVEKIKFGTTLGYSMDPGDPVTYIAKGYANGKLVPLLCKRYDVWREWPGFHTEMYLYSSSEHLRPLQGKCVPHIISVQTIPGGYLTVNCELLSVNGWSDAHPDGKFISQEKKKRILEAYHRIHKQGVLHGSVSLHNIAISDDSRVHILDFRKSRALVSCRAVGLYSCTQEELDFEMRYVRFILDWNGAKRKEKEMWMGDSAGSQKQWLAADKARLQRSPTNIVPRQSHELWDVEKEEWRVFDNRNVWFDTEAKPKPPRKHVVPSSFVDDCFFTDVQDSHSTLDVHASVNAALLDQNYSLRARSGSRSSRSSLSSQRAERREQPAAHLYAAPPLSSPFLTPIQLGGDFPTPYLEKVEKAARQHQSRFDKAPGHSSLDPRLLEPPSEGESTEQKRARLEAINAAIEVQTREVEIAKATQEFYTRLEEVVLAERDRFEESIKKKRVAGVSSTIPEVGIGATGSLSIESSSTPGESVRGSAALADSGTQASVETPNRGRESKSATNKETALSTSCNSSAAKCIPEISTFNPQLSSFIPLASSPSRSPSASRQPSVGTPEPLSEEERKRALTRRVGGILNRRAPARGRHGPTPNQRSRLSSPFIIDEGSSSEGKDEGPRPSQSATPSPQLQATSVEERTPKKRKRGVDDDLSGDLGKGQDAETRSWSEPVTKRIRQAHSYITSFWS